MGRRVGQRDGKNMGVVIDFYILFCNGKLNI
jgi:hypothetical protein